MIWLNVYFMKLYFMLGLILSHTIVTWLSLSALDCSCQNPKKKQTQKINPDFHIVYIPAAVISYVTREPFCPLPSFDCTISLFSYYIAHNHPAFTIFYLLLLFLYLLGTFHYSFCRIQNSTFNDSMLTFQKKIPKLIFPPYFRQLCMVDDFLESN